MQLLHTVIEPDVTPAGDGVVSIDLPVNPLSRIAITLKALNAATELLLADFFSMVTNVQTTMKGANIIQGSLLDIAVMNALVTGVLPRRQNIINTDNGVRSLTVPIHFGRRFADPKECFPAVKRGDHVLQLTVDVAVTAGDGLILQIETDEILDAAPEQFLKYTTNSVTPTATGDMSADLPLGNPLLGVLLFSTTVPTTTAWTSSVNTASILVDNVQTAWALTNWETLNGLLTARANLSNYLLTHTHYLSTDSEDSLTGESGPVDPFRNYGYLDLDPLKDDTYAIQTAGKGRCHLGINAGDTNAIRYLPLELIKVAAGGAAA
jgi:hypothetical protein